jgi:hypothetical protein
MARKNAPKVIKDKQTTQLNAWDDIVKFSVGGGQLDDKYTRRWVNKTMVGTMKWGDEILKQIIAVKVRAAANLQAGEKFKGEASKNKKMLPETALATAEAVEDPTTTGTFNQLDSFRRKIIDSTGWHMGHKTLSISTLQTAAYLAANKEEPLGGDFNSSENQAFRQELRALYMAQKNLDALTTTDWEAAKETGAPGKAGVDMVLSQLEKLEKGFDITDTHKRDVDIAKGIGEETSKFEMEDKKFNDWKSKVNAKLTLHINEMWTTQAGAKIKNVLKNYNIAEMTGSTTLMRDIKDSFIEQAVTGKKPKKKRLPPKKNKTRVGKKIKGVAQNRKKIQNLQKKLKREMIAFKNVPIPHKKSSSGGAGSQKQLISLVSLLNAKLPRTVAENMGAPGLENRTGTLASSARITDVSRTAKGYPSLGYTYQRNPYQVFEMGVGHSSWATTARDPRTLIDASIREIAQKLAVGRFYTRRN